MAHTAASQGLQSHPTSSPLEQQSPREAPRTDPVDEGDRLWRQVRAAATDKKPADHAPVEHLEYESFDGRTLRLRPDNDEPGLARWLGSQTGALAKIVER